MKKIQVIFAVAAILFAVAGVFASKFSFTTYFRAADTNFGILGEGVVDCSEMVSPTCSQGTLSRCTMQVQTQLPGEEVPTWKTYSISKIVDANPCQQVKKNI